MTPSLRILGAWSEPGVFWVEETKMSNLLPKFLVEYFEIHYNKPQETHSSLWNMWNNENT